MAGYWPAAGSTSLSGQLGAEASASLRRLIYDFSRMPSGKRARQQRRQAAKTPPPVRSKGGSFGSGFRFSRRALTIAGAALVVLVALGIGLGLAFAGGGSNASSGHLAPLSTLGKLASAPPLGPTGPETAPLEGGSDLAPAGAPAPGSSVDGITCQQGEQLVFHIHARVTIFVDGKPKRVPAGVGIADPQTSPTPEGPMVAAGSCFAWLHTHAADGIVHIESPVQRTFTLGNFFDVWGQPLSPTRVGPARGHVTALFDGQVWRGDPRDIPLQAHAQIQLEVGRPLVAPVRITNWGGL
jgi:hypothetical protein